MPRTNLYQCPYDEHTKCSLTDPCLGCEEFAANIKEARPTCAQQLKLAIAALIPGIVTSFTLGDEKQFITLTNELRQLTSN